jgi:hypothetical protein
MDETTMELLTDEMADVGHPPATSSSSEGERITTVELAIRQHGWGLAATRQIRRAVRNSEVFFLERHGRDDTQPFCWYMDESHRQSMCIPVFTTRARLEHYRALHPEVSDYHPSRIDGRRLLGMGSAEYAFIDAGSQTAYYLPLRRATAADLRRLRALFEHVRGSHPEEGYFANSAAVGKSIFICDEGGRLQLYSPTDYAYAYISVAEDRFRDGGIYSARAYVDAALGNLDPSGDEMPRARCSMLLASLDSVEWEYDAAFVHLVEVVRLCGSAGDLQGEAEAMLQIAVSPRISSRPDLAERWGRTASELFEVSIHPDGQRVTVALI